MKTEKLDTEQLYRFLEESFVKKTKSASSSKMATDASESAFTPKAQIRIMLENIFDVCQKRGYISSKMDNSFIKKIEVKFSLPSFDKSRFSGGTSFRIGEGYKIGFRWNVLERGIYKYPNGHILDSVKDKDDLHLFTVYGYDDSILLDTCTQKSFFGRKETFNIQLHSLVYDYHNDSLVMNWLSGCRANEDHASVNLEKKINFDKCSKKLQLKILKSLQKKYRQLEKI
ncbi:MAG: hypothetical protein ACI4TD_12375 [Phocaeicola sp.]